MALAEILGRPLCIPCIIDSGRFFEGYERDGEPKQVVRNGTTCLIQYFKGEHSNEFVAQSGKEVRHYKHGLLKGLWNVSDDKVTGEFEILDDGCALFRQEWNSLTKDFWIRTVNEKEHCMKEIVDAHTQAVIYRGGLNENGQRMGRGIEFEYGLDKLKMEGIWKNDKLIRIIRLFKGKIMTEFRDTTDNLNVFDRSPIYYGEYWYDEVHNSYRRHGHGFQINTEGIANTEGQWEHGIELRQWQLTNGWYKIEENPLKEVPDVTDIVVDSYVFESASYLNLNCYKEVETITIGDHNFINVDHFNVTDLNALQKLEIGDYSFYKNDRSARFDRTFCVTDCAKLQTIIIGLFSFNYFSSRFELARLPSLEHLEIGKIGEDSSCFSYCNVEITGLL